MQFPNLTTAEPSPGRYWALGNEMDGPWQMGHRFPPHSFTQLKATLV